jgi:MOSC domain-containing protein YiiM/ferredoxin-NADP reductase
LTVMIGMRPGHGGRCISGESSMNGKVASLNVGEPRLVSYRGTSFRTGILKTPIDAPLTLKRLNFTGDGQADLSAHGGIDKAVYCYPLEHYAFWRREIGRAALPMGQFGENVTTEGLLENELRIGDILRMGTALLQVSEPRIPCYKLVMHMNAGSDFSVRFLAANRSGFYCRVLEEGIVAPSDPITLISRDLSSPAVSEVVAATQFADRDPVKLRQVVGARDISTKWRTRVRRMIDAELRRRMEQAGPQSRVLIVDEIVPEARDVTSIWLAARDGGSLPAALPGQYLTLAWPDGLKRTYSISATEADRRYRITVKLALGRGSARIATLKVGDTLDVERPRGNFHPDVAADTPLVLAAAGIGATPIMNMLDHVTRGGGRNVFAAFGMRHPETHPLMNELKALMAERRNLQVQLAYSQYDGAPLAGLPAPKHGRLAAADLLPHAAAPLAEIFLCGPGEFIRQMHDGLAAAGINPMCIRYEAFGPSTLLPARGEAAADPAAKFNVTFTRSNMEAVWTPAAGTLLNLAEAAGVSPTFGCRAGSCGLCRTAIADGSVSYVEPIDEPEAGYVYPCCAIPQADCRLDM